MAFYVEQTRDRFDWSREATGERSVVGMSGNRAALLIAGELTADLLDPGDESEAVVSLQAKLLEQAPSAEDYEPPEWREPPDVGDLVEAGVHKSVEVTPD
jgi:hypothetical protein